MDGYHDNSFEERKTFFVLPLEMTFAGVVYWRVCEGNTNNCVGVCDDLPSALIKATELARRHSDAGRPVRILWRNPGDATWSEAGREGAIGGEDAQ